MIIEPLQLPPTERALNELKGLLSDCVAGGASIGFLLGSGDEEVGAYWKKVTDEAALGQSRLILVARKQAGSPIIGSVQLSGETRANGRHRAELQKLMVLREQRGHGVATLLVRELEKRAVEKGIKLLFLDTSEGDGGAKRFYELLGYIYAGGIPNYALDPDGSPTQNAIYFKLLQSEGLAPEEGRREKIDGFFLAPMNEAHWPEVAKIYGEGIETGHATFAANPPASWGDFAKSKISDCILVCIDPIEGKVMGWVALSPISTRQVYAGVTELSLYVATAHRGRGVGRTLMTEIIRASEARGIWTLQSSTFPENKASIALQQRFGFRILGRRERVALMEYGPFVGRWRDTLLLERRSAIAGR